MGLSISSLWLGQFPDGARHSKKRTIIKIDLVFSLWLLRPLSRLGKEISQTFDNHFDFVRCGRASKAEADGTHSDFGRDVHGFQNRRQLDAARMTGRSRCDGNAIESRQYLGADLSDEGSVEGVRQPMRGMPVEDDAISESLR